RDPLEDRLAPVVVDPGFHVRRGHHHLHAVAPGDTQELQGLLDLLRPVVDAGQEMVVQIDHASSFFSGRASREATASRGDVPPNSTALTCPAIGISTPCVSARATTARVVATPSATIRIPERTAWSFRPRPTSRP